MRQSLCLLVQPCHGLYEIIVLDKSLSEWWSNWSNYLPAAVVPARRLFTGSERSKVQSQLQLLSVSVRVSCTSFIHCALFCCWKRKEQAEMCEKQTLNAYCVTFHTHLCQTGGWSGNSLKQPNEDFFKCTQLYFQNSKTHPKKFPNTYFQKAHRMMCKHLCNRTFWGCHRAPV